MDDALTAYIDAQRGRFDGAERLLLALYRQLGLGQPVGAADLAEACAAAPGEVETILAGLPASWLEVDDDGAVVGFAGLSLDPTPHRVAVDGRTLYTWCAFDSLFVAGLLGRAVEIGSTCPASAQPIRLRADPERVLERRPRATVMSFVTPEEEARRRALRRVFCDHVNFYASAGAAQPWRAANPDGLVIDVDAAHALGRRRNAVLFGAALAS